MTSTRAFTLVAIWLAAGALIAFLMSIAPHVDHWLREHQHLSGWAQALGTIVAIAGAWTIGQQQSKTSLALEQERERLQRVRHLQTAFVTLSNAVDDTHRISTIDIRSQEGTSEFVRVCAQCVSDLEQLVLFELPPFLISPISNAKAMLQTLGVAIQRLGPPSDGDAVPVLADMAAIRNVCTRGRDLAWLALRRVLTEKEKVDELQWRAEISEYRRRTGDPRETRQTRWQ